MSKQMKKSEFLENYRDDLQRQQGTVHWHRFEDEAEYVDYMIQLKFAIVLAHQDEKKAKHG